MELREALAQISEIRDQVARTATFRGYRSLTAAFSGLLALSAAAVQYIWIPNPSNNASAYLALWIAAALGSMLAAATEMYVRGRASQSALSQQLTVLAIEQFLPCVVAGAVITAAMAARAVSLVWMLPGVWSVLFSLGLFASHRLLPRPIFAVAFYYLACGTILLTVAEPTVALSPWSMGITFGLGQLSSAVILYLALERTNEPTLD